MTIFDSIRTRGNTLSPAMEFFRVAACWALAAQLAAAPLALAGGDKASSTPAPADPVLKAMQG